MTDVSGNDFRWSASIQIPRTCQRFLHFWQLRVMSTLPPMMEISSIRTCFPKIGTRRAVQEPFIIGGKLTLVYRPSEADVDHPVTSRPSEDVLCCIRCAPRGTVAIFCGASWSRWSPVRRNSAWSRSLKKGFGACKGTSKPVLVAGPGAPKWSEAKRTSRHRFARSVFYAAAKAGQPLLSFLVPVQRLHRPGRNCETIENHSRS